MKWIDPPAYLSGASEVSVYPDWRTTNRPIGPILNAFTDNHKQWIDASGNRIYNLSPTYSFTGSQILIPSNQDWRTFDISDDGNTLALCLEVRYEGYRIYVRTRYVGSLYSSLREIYRPERNSYGIFSTRLSADGDTLAWTENRPMGAALLVMRNLHSQPVISEVLIARDISHESLRLSADGKWVFVSSNSRYDIQEGWSRANLFSRFADGEWSVAKFLRVDGEVHHSSVRDVNSDGSYIQIGYKVAYRDGDEYRTLYDFEPTRFDKTGGSMSEDGRSVVYLSGDEDPWDSLDPRDRSRLERTSIPETDLVLVTYVPGRDQAVQTQIIDSGFMFVYHYRKDGSRLVWTKQEEDPFRDIVSVEDWSTHADN